MAPLIILGVQKSFISMVLILSGTGLNLEVDHTSYGVTSELESRLMRANRQGEKLQTAQKQGAV